MLTFPSLAAEVRPAAVAGQWYPQEAQVLNQLIEEFLQKVSSPTLPKVRALLVPHAGYPFSGQVAAYAYRLVAGQAFQRVMVVAPTHYGHFYGLAVSEASYFETPLGKIALDKQAITQLRKNSLVVVDETAQGPEYSIESQLPFLQKVLQKGWRLLPILVADLTEEDSAKAAKLLKSWADDQTLIVISGDFTHYGPRYHYVPFPPDNSVATRLWELDQGIYEKIAAHDLAGLLAYREKTGITACVLDPLMIVLHWLSDRTQVTLLKYETSGKLTGDYVNSVSYLALAITSEQALSRPEGPLRESEMQFLHKLARLALAASVGKKAKAEENLRTLTAKVSDELKRPLAVFVTLKEHGELRGCIGTLVPQEALYRAVIDNAVRAALYDRRFYPVRVEELDDLEVEISVLSEPQAIASYREFELGKHGIILEKDEHQAVFLPEVPIEQKWTREQTLAHLAQKAGLASDAWQEAKFQVFTTQTYTTPRG